MRLIYADDAIYELKRAFPADDFGKIIRCISRTPTADVVEVKDIEAECELAYKHGWSDCFAEHRWIPVTERLPEANEKDENNFNKAYLVQDGRWMDVARWDGEYWVAWGYGTVLKNVIAWMPLPKPWKGDRGCRDIVTAITMN